MYKRQLYFSAALQQPLPLSALRLLTLASAVAICEGIADCCGLQVDIKWPNDLYWRGRKLGGILTECSLVGESGELEYAVCGAGLNCAATPCPPELRGEIVSLEEALGGPPPARAALLAALLQRLEGAFDRLLQGEGSRSLLEGYRARLLWVGETVEVSRGSERYRAVFEGVDGEGRALLQAGGEVQALSSGEDVYKRQALDEADPGGDFEGYGFDIDPQAVELTLQNAKLAGVGEKISARVEDITRHKLQDAGGILLSNPPYGERMLGPAQVKAIHQALGKMHRYNNLKSYIITSAPHFEEQFGKTADRRRKLYNGELKCQLYMYYKSVSYTHLDVYKRQDQEGKGGRDLGRRARRGGPPLPAGPDARKKGAKASGVGNVFLKVA